MVLDGCHNGRHSRIVRAFWEGTDVQKRGGWSEELDMEPKPEHMREKEYWADVASQSLLQVPAHAGIKSDLEQ